MYYGQDLCTAHKPRRPRCYITGVDNGKAIRLACHSSQEWKGSGMARSEASARAEFCLLPKTYNVGSPPPSRNIRPLNRPPARRPEDAREVLSRFEIMDPTHPNSSFRPCRVQSFGGRAIVEEDVSRSFNISYPSRQISLPQLHRCHQSCGCGRGPLDQRFLSRCALGGAQSCSVGR